MPQSPVEVTRLLDASQEAVFRAWTQPSELEKWWCTPGYHCRQMEVALCEAGAYYFELAPNEGVEGPICTMEGTFSQVDIPNALTYSWTIRAGEFEVGGTTVNVRFIPRGEQTEVVLRHDGFMTPEGRELHAVDWPIVLTNLEKALEEGLKSASGMVVG